MSLLLAHVTAALAGLMLVIGVRRAVADHIRISRVPGARRRLQSLARRLTQAGVRIGVETYASAWAAGAVGLPIAAWTLTGRPVLALGLALAALVAGAWLPATAPARERRRLAAQLPDLAARLGESLRAGMSLRQALTRAADSAPDPLAAELRQTVGELRYGARLDDALAGLVERVPEPELQVMTTAILVQRRAGGNLARGLADLGTRLSERGRLERELRTATAQARMTGGLVAAVPLVAGAMVELAAPGTLGRTLGNPAGLTLVTMSLALQGAGFVLVRRLSRIDV
jgi:tight adherence protein B